MRLSPEEMRTRWERAQAIVRSAHDQKRPMNAAESAQYSTLTMEIEAARADSFNAELRQPVGRRAGMDNPSQRLPGGQAVRARDHVLTRDQSYADWMRVHGHLDDDTSRDEPLSMGRMVRGILTGDWRHAEAEQRSLGSAPGSAGGYLIPGMLSATMIDRLRQKTRVLEAGAQLVPMEGPEITFARLTGGVTASWTAEGATIVPSDPTFGQVNMVSKTLVAGPVKMSRQLLQDAKNLDFIIEHELTNACAVAVDQAALRGMGAALEPAGIDAYTAAQGINEQSMGTNGATPTDWDKVVDAMTDILTDNAPRPTAAIWHPSIAGTYGKLKTGLTSDKTPLRMPAILEGLTFYDTTAVRVDETQGAASTASRIYLGDFSEMFIGVQQEITLLPIQERYVENLQVGFLAFMRADVVLQHLESFGRVIGILP